MHRDRIWTSAWECYRHCRRWRLGAQVMGLAQPVGKDHEDSIESAFSGRGGLGVGAVRMLDGNLDPT
jgi:hypothetical protein